MNMKLMAVALATLAGAAAFAGAKKAKKLSPEEQAKADAHKQEVAAQCKVRDAFSTGYGCWNDDYLSRFGAEEHHPMLSDEELAKRRAATLAAQAKLVELEPQNAGFRLDCGQTLMFFDRAKEALVQFEAALPVAGKRRSEVLFWIAEAKFGLGDVAAAQKTLEDLVAGKKPNYGRHDTDYHWYAATILRLMKGDVLDGLKLPCDATAKPFPKPHEAELKDEFVALKDVKVALAGVKADDARVALLTAKLARLGVKAEVGHGSYPLTLALDPAAPVAEPEGYSLATAREGAEIRARDLQGVLWGVVSFLQMVNPEKTELRLGTVRDWPDGTGRGWLGSFDANLLEFALFNKMNSVNVQRRPPTQGNFFTPLRTWMSAEMARHFKSFGLTLYYSGNWICHAPQLPISCPRTLPFRIEVVKRFAKMGAGFYYALDDMRFPLCAADKAKFGTAANCDAKQVNEIFQAVVKEYPDFKMIFCPPFYWGPDSKAPYPEDREAYLKSIGEFLDKRVDVYWTGAQVKGYEKSKRQVAWIAGLIGRKPSIFQNGIGPHNLLDYLVDPIEWKKMHYDGFAKDVSCFHNNSLSIGELGPLSTQAAWLWNESDYVATEAVKSGVNQFCGAQAYDLLAPGLEPLAYFDKYRYGKLNENIVYEDPKDLEAKLAQASDAWKRAMAACPKVGSYGSFGRGVGWAANVVKGAKKPPDFLAKYKGDIAATHALALKETRVELKVGEKVLTPCDLQNLTPTKGKYGAEGTMRFVKWLRGANTRECEVAFNFECDPFPPTGDYVLTVSGIQDELPDDTVLAVTVNGRKVLETPCGFPATAGAAGRGDFARRDFRIPFDSLQRHNRVKLACATPGFNPKAAPYIGINYIVLRKTK